MSIYTKPITDITFQDVVDFCRAGHRENIELDYKVKEPSEIEKTVCAFANTRGGIILIGVDEDSNNKPDFSKPLGLEHKPRLQDTVNQKIMDNLWPPIDPEIQVCPPEKGKTFIVVRVPQGHATPYYVRGKNQIYIRTETNNKPTNSHPDHAQLEWLFGKRVKSIEFREHKLNEMRKRFNYVLEQIGGAFAEHLHLRIVISPLYPKDPLCEPRRLRDVITSNVVTRPLDRTSFPYLGFGKRTTADGIIISNMLDSTGNVLHQEVPPDFLHTEISVHGVILFNRSYLERFEQWSEHLAAQYQKTNERLFFLNWLLETMDPVLHFARNFLGKRVLPLNLFVELTNVAETFFFSGLSDTRPETPVAGIDKTLTYKAELSSQSLTDNPSRVFHDVGIYFARGAGIEVTKPMISRWLEKSTQEGRITTLCE